MTYTSVQSLESAQRVPSRPALDTRTVIATRRGIRLATAFIYPAGIEAAVRAANQLPPPPAEININPASPCFVKTISF